MKLPRNALGQHLQFSTDTHLHLTCERLQVLQDESIITNERLEQLEATLARNNNLEELHDAISGNMGRLEELEASLAKASRLEMSNKTKLQQLEARLSRKQQEHDELIESARRTVEGLQSELGDVKRRLQELANTSVRTGTKPPDSASLNMPTIRTPTAPPYPRPATHLPRIGGRIRTPGSHRLEDTTEDGSENINEQRQQDPPASTSISACPQELSPEICVSNKFIWKFSQFEDCLQKAKDGSRAYYRSNPFQNGPYGYRMCVEFHPNGLNEGCDTYLSIFVCLLQGQYDDILPWPFKQKVTITLIDQQPNLSLRRNIQMTSLPRNNSQLSRQCYSKPSELSPRNVAFGFSKFISQERLKTRRFLVNDTIFVCVEVDQS